MNADPEVMAFFAAPMTRAESDEAIDRYLMQLDRDGFTMFAAEMNETGELAGIIGMQTMRDAVPNLPQPAVEIGWRLRRSAWGQGLATEGARAVIQHAFDQHHLEELVAITAISNMASRRVMEKLNMAHRPELDFDHPRVPAGHPHQRHALYSLAKPSTNIFRSVLAVAVTLMILPFVGCNSAPTPSTPPKPPVPTATYPPRPSIPAPAFKVFHHTDSSITLVTKENASDEEIEALIYQLRDAAHTHGFDKLHIDQKTVDARKPSVWFHIYRGAKCASEKYADGPPPCGASYHAAGDYTFGGGPTNPDWDTGILLHNERETPLWNSDAPYTPPQGR